MFIDVGFCQKKKHDENACGDFFVSKRNKDTDKVTAILADGLGSGIKANILSCMTATMLLRFLEEQSDIKTACEIIMNSLPVCKERNISYSTFSAIECYETGAAKIVEEGNPDFIWIRGNNILSPNFKEITSKTFPDRHMHLYNIKAEEGDRIIFCSDGVTQAALGSKELPSGIERTGLIKILQAKLEENNKISSRKLAEYIIRQVELITPNHKLKDDTSVCTLYFRTPEKAVLFTGPPFDGEQDKYYAENFYGFAGKKAIAGGTTAHIIARELNLEIENDTGIQAGKLPNISHIKGIDLVTEGVLTLTKTAEYLETGTPCNDAAGKLMNFFLSSDEIKIMSGVKLNQAHYNPNLPVEIEIRKNIIKRIARLLEEKYTKKVDVVYI